MSDWTPEQIEAVAEHLHREWFTSTYPNAAVDIPWWPAAEEHKDVYRQKARGVLSAVDLSDHDRAVAADALRQAADAAADNCASVLNDDDPTEANRWADTEHWLRARAEAVGDE